MNKIFSRVWSRALQQLVVASELACARGKGAGVRGHGPALLVLSMSLIAVPAWADGATGDPATPACTSAQAPQAQP
ncbi:MAG: ESPR domain-containing protein, partial [Pseudoxanthomonas sp.]